MCTVIQRSGYYYRNMIGVISNSPSLVKAEEVIGMVQHELLAGALDVLILGCIQSVSLGDKSSDDTAITVD